MGGATVIIRVGTNHVRPIRKSICLKKWKAFTVNGMGRLKLSTKKWLVCTFHLLCTIALNFYRSTLLDANWIQLKTCSCNMQANFIDFVDRHSYSTFNHACTIWSVHGMTRNKNYEIDLHKGKLFRKKHSPFQNDYYYCERWIKLNEIKKKIRNIKVYWLKCEIIIYMNIE